MSLCFESIVLSPIYVETSEHGNGTSAYHEYIYPSSRLGRRYCENNTIFLIWIFTQI